MTKKTIDWNFPLNNYGKTEGINDSGIETFSGRSVEALGKEILQNSLDAKYGDETKPVIVKFTLHSIKSEQFPGRNKLLNILESCLNFWTDDTKAKRILNSALSTLKDSSIKVLKISDYNTTGLTDSDKEFLGNFNNLIKSVGVSNKDDQSGGSFGIGKHAAYSCSRLRTVFYSTKDIEGNKAVQGVAKLATHKDENSEPTQGTGYFGVKEKNRPVTDGRDIDKFFDRDEVGTDVYVMGFNESEDWKTQIIRSVLDNFFVAIMDKKLVVDIEEVRIDNNTIHGIIEKYLSEDSSSFAYKYYKTLITKPSKNKFEFPEDFNNMGAIELHILKGKNLPKKVAFVRGTGMKILDKGHFRTTLNFMGVLLVKGKEINKFLRDIETPSHDAFEPGRHENSNEAKKTLKKLYEFINKKIRSLTENDEGEELEVEGISQYLPDDIEDTRSNIQTGEGEKNKIKDIEMRELPSRKNSYAEVVVDQDDESEKTDTQTDMDEDNTSPNGEGSNNDGDGNIDNPGNGSGSTGDGGNDTDDVSNDDNDKSTASESVEKNKKSLVMQKSRVFCIDNDKGIYRVIIVPNNDGKVFMNLNLVFEDGGEAAPVKKAIDKDSKTTLNVTAKGKIGPINLKKDTKTIVDVMLNKAIRCAMEVKISAN